MTQLVADGQLMPYGVLQALLPFPPGGGIVAVFQVLPFHDAENVSFWVTTPKPAQREAVAQDTPARPESLGPATLSADHF